MRICIGSGWLAVDPYINYKPKAQKVHRIALTKEELLALTEKEMSFQRLQLVKDIFLFCCYTGLAYVDVKKLKRSEVIKGIDGQYWIYTNRQKTDTLCRIPVLPAAMDIIVRHQNNPQCINEGKLLPVMSNQKMNAYLKEIADLCGISKVLTFHIARHTFATTITLNNGVPIESVAKMMGHTSINTTQIYAKVNHNGGTQINLNENIVSDIIKGRDNNTLSHEFGHSLGLYHVNQKITYDQLDARQYYPVARQATKDSLNAMFSGDSRYMHDSTSTVITPRQMDIIIEKYRFGKLNRQHEI